MTQPTCKTCRFFEAYDGTCHERKLPLPGFPFVKLDDWCGRHLPSTPIVTENLT
jgi:hypothetical protein